MELNLGTANAVHVMAGGKVSLIDVAQVFLYSRLQTAASPFHWAFA
jgi:hypothetical protein